MSAGLRTRITLKMKEAPAAPWSDTEIAKSLEVMPATVANEMTGLIHAGVVKRVAPRTYQLAVLEAQPAREDYKRCTHDLAAALSLPTTMGWSELVRRARELEQSVGGVPKERWVELAHALGITEDSARPRNWGELLAAARAIRLAARRLDPRVCEALDIPYDADTAAAPARIAELKREEQFAKAAREALGVPDDVPVADDKVLTRLSMLTSVERELANCQKAIGEVATSRARAEQRERQLRRGFRAMRALLDALDDEE